MKKKNIFNLETIYLSGSDKKKLQRFTVKLSYVKNKCSNLNGNEEFILILLTLNND